MVRLVRGSASPRAWTRKEVPYESHHDLSTAAISAPGLLSFPFPMVTKEVLGANTVHTIIYGGLTPLLMLAGIGVSAAAFGKTFHLYAILTLMALVGLSVVSGVLAARANAGEPVRWFGFAEPALIGVWLQWVAALAIVLLRRPRRYSYV